MCMRENTGHLSVSGFISLMFISTSTHFPVCYNFIFL